MTNSGLLQFSPGGGQWATPTGYHSLSRQWLGKIATKVAAGRFCIEAKASKNKPHLSFFHGQLAHGPPYLKVSQEKVGCPQGVEGSGVERGGGLLGGDRLSGDIIGSGICNLGIPDKFQPYETKPQIKQNIPNMRNKSPTYENKAPTYEVKPQMFIKIINIKTIYNYWS